MSGELTELEQAELRRLKAVVDEGCASYRRAGEALAQIRDRRLYRGTHNTFEAYCHYTWCMTDRHARRLIEAAFVVADLEKTAGPNWSGMPLPKNEAQARALAAAPEEQRADVWQRAVEEAKGKAPSAQRVEELVAKITAWKKPEELAAMVRASDAEAIKRGEELDQLTQEGTKDWHVRKARWHLKQVIRHLKASGHSAGQDAAALDALIVADQQPTT